MGGQCYSVPRRTDKSRRRGLRPQRIPRAGISQRLGLPGGGMRQSFGRYERFVFDNWITERLANMLELMIASNSFRVTRILLS